MPHITLNNDRIEIDGEVTYSPVSPFTAKMSMGKEEFADYNPCSIWEYADGRGGVGMEAEDERTDRVAWSTSIELTKERDFRLGPLVKNLGDLGTPLLLHRVFKDADYFFGNSVSKYNNAGTLTEADASPLSSPTDALVFTDSTNTYLIVCNGSDVRYCSVGYGGSKDWAALSTSNIKYMCSYDKRLIGVDAAGTTVFKSDRDDCDDANGGAMDSFSISGPWSEARDLFTGKSLAGDDEDAIYMLTDVGLVVIDYWTRVAYLLEARASRLENALCGAYWNGDVYYATGCGLRKINQSVNSAYGPDADDGLPSDVVGYIYDMLGTLEWLVIAVSGGTNSSILKRRVNLGGWCEIYTSSSNMRAIGYSDVTAPGRLYFGEGNYVRYIQFPDKTHDITKVSGYEYAASGEVTFPRFSRLSILRKILKSIEALTSGCSSDEKITVYYRVNENTDWTTAGTFTTNGKPTKISVASGAGAAFYDIQIKVKLERGSTTTNTPVLKSLCFKFIPAPPWVYRYTFNIIATGARAKDIITKLETARDSSTLVNFSPVGDTGISEKWVKIESLPSIRDLDRFAAGQKFTVAVTEVDD